MSQAALCLLLSLTTASLSAAYSFAGVRAPSPGATGADSAAHALGRRRGTERMAAPQAFFERERLEPEPELDQEGGDGELGQTRRTATRAYNAAEEYDGYYAPLSYSPDRLRGSDLNELLYPNYMDRAKFNVSPMQVGAATPQKLLPLLAHPSRRLVAPRHARRARVPPHLLISHPPPPRRPPPPLVRQAYGALFKFDTVLEGMHELNKESWTAVATEHDFEPPDDDDVMRATGMMPERAIQNVFRWTDDWGETRRLAYEGFEAKSRLLPDWEFKPTPGAVDWLRILSEYQVPRVITSTMGREQALQVLEKAGLAELLPQVVSADDGFETTEQAYLLCCLAIERPPSRCVVFEDEPSGVVAAHDAMTKVVAIIGNHPAYSFKHADYRIGSLEELSLMSLREVFRDEGPR